MTPGVSLTQQPHKMEGAGLVTLETLRQLEKDACSAWDVVLAVEKRAGGNYDDPDYRAACGTHHEAFDALIAAHREYGCMNCHTNDIGEGGFCSVECASEWSRVHGASRK